MFHHSPLDIMSQIPDDRQQYDPCNNYATDRPLRGSHAYTQKAFGNYGHPNLRGLSQDGRYQWLEPQRAATTFPSGPYPPMYHQTTPYHNQLSGQIHESSSNPTVLNAGNELNMGCASNVADYSIVQPLSQGAGRSVVRPPLSQGQPNQVSTPKVSSYAQLSERLPEQKVRQAEANHVVEWRCKPSEYQATNAENSINFPTPSSTFARPRKKQKGMDVQFILNSEDQTMLQTSPNSHKGGTNHAALHQMPVKVGASVSPDAIQNKKAAANVVAGNLLKCESVLARPVSKTDQSLQLGTVVNMKEESIGLPAKRMKSPVESRKPSEVADPSTVILNYSKLANASCPAPKLPDGGDVPLSAIPRSRLEDEPRQRRKSTPPLTDDIFATFPLKKSKYATQRESNARKEGKTKPNKVQGSRAPKAKIASKRQGKRRLDSYSLLEHSGDESGSSSEGKSDSRNSKRRPLKKTATLSYSDDDDFDEIGSRSKRKNSKRKEDNNEQKLNRVETVNKSLKKRKEPREGARKSSRLSKRKMNTEFQPEREVTKKRKEVHRNERKSKKTKSLDELSDVHGEKSDSSDNSDDFVPISKREKNFETMKAKWEANQRIGEDQSSTPKSGAKRSTRKRTKRNRTPTKSNGSDGENTRVDDQAHDSDSPNASQRGSQPLNVKITSLSTKRRRRKTDYEDERKRLTENELTTIRLAFVAHYPPPPSNAQVQGRFEVKYGREMSQAMIQGLWEKELKHWSERWWLLYMGFNDHVREKKLAKPIDKDPTLHKKEVEEWAKSYYKEHGDAKVSSIELKPSTTKSNTSTCNHSDDSKNGNDTQRCHEDSNTEKGASDKCVPRTDLDSPKVNPGGANMTSGVDARGDQEATDSRVAAATEEANTVAITPLGNPPKDDAYSNTIVKQDGDEVVCNAAAKRE